MRRTTAAALVATLAGLAFAVGFVVALDQAPGAAMPGAAALADPARCTPCHADDATRLWSERAARPCTPYCLTCHAKDEMSAHHPVDVELPKAPRAPLRLTVGGRTACFTCHDLAQPREDARSWRAESLYDRVVRRPRTHRTYYLVERNDRGQLCRACH